MLQCWFAKVRSCPSAIISCYNNNVNYDAAPDKLTIHAEESALMACKKKHLLDRCTMIVIRVSHGELASSKPCSGCEALILKHHIRRVYYSV